MAGRGSMKKAFDMLNKSGLKLKLGLMVHLHLIRRILSALSFNP